MRAAKSRMYVALTTMVIAVAAVSPGSAQPFDLAWHTVDGGGNMLATGGTLELSATIGQSDAGRALTGGTLELIGGFWPGARRRPVPGDCNSNGVVQLDDFACFAACFTGPGGVYSLECATFDLDSDGDVDGTDYAAFFSQFGG